jgi:alpha-galactosidase/6-phospho-beta-glucosidase family protein
MTTDTPMAVEINCETGEETIRPLNADELAQRAKDIAEYEAQRAEAEAKAAADAAAKDALLTKLGITADEAKLLLA